MSCIEPSTTDMHAYTSLFTSPGRDNTRQGAEDGQGLRCRIGQTAKEKFVLLRLAIERVMG